jgi:DNA-binding protein HU-beta
MNFTETAEALVAKGGYRKKDAEKFIRDFEEVIMEGLNTGDRTVRFGGIGTFHVVQRAERQGRNPLTKEAITIPAKKAVTFKASKVLKSSVNK